MNISCGVRRAKNEFIKVNLANVPLGVPEKFEAYMEGSMTCKSVIVYFFSSSCHTVRFKHNSGQAICEF